jgi:hypothetical protein
MKKAVFKVYNTKYRIKEMNSAFVREARFLMGFPNPWGFYHETLMDAVKHVIDIDSDESELEYIRVNRLAEELTLVGFFRLMLSSEITVSGLWEGITQINIETFKTDYFVLFPNLNSISCSSFVNNHEDEEYPLVRNLSITLPSDPPKPVRMSDFICFPNLFSFYVRSHYSLKVKFFYDYIHNFIKIVIINEGIEMDKRVDLSDHGYYFVGNTMELEELIENGRNPIIRQETLLEILEALDYEEVTRPKIKELEKVEELSKDIDEKVGPLTRDLLSLGVETDEWVASLQKVHFFEYDE